MLVLFPYWGIKKRRESEGVVRKVERSLTVYNVTNKREIFEISTEDKYTNQKETSDAADRGLQNDGRSH